MYKKTISYVDFNGVSREEDFYFHLTKAEMLKFEFSEQGGISAIIDSLVKEENTFKMLELFERLVRMSYGKRSADGRRFEKKPEFADEFISSEAYSALFIDFMQDADKAAEFVNGICASIEVDPNKKSAAQLLNDHNMKVVSSNVNS